MKRIIVAALGALLALPAVAAAAPRAKVVPVYACQSDFSLPEIGPGTLEAYKSFREDGTVQTMSVRWKDYRGSFVRLADPGDNSEAEFNWPASDDEPFDWSRGAVEIGYSLAVRPRSLSGEEWSRIVVDRDRSILTGDQDGMKLMYLFAGDLHLAGDLQRPNGPFSLTSPIGALLAWGSGQSRIRVYRTLITRREPAKNSYPVSPAGRERIVGEYEIDMAAFAAAVDRVRETTRSWEATLATGWRQCRHTSEGGDTLISGARP